jgi:integrase
MASIEKRTRNGSVRWYARYRDPAGQQRVRVFDRKVDAERHLTSVESSKLTGSYVSPAGGRVTIHDWAEQWLATKLDVKPSTRERYAGIIRQWIEPRWGRVRISEVSHAAVQQWASTITDSIKPASVAKVYRTLSQILDLAVRDGRLVRNPAAGVSLPRVVATERRYLSHAQLHALAAECGHYRLAVLFAGYTGVRFGELAALRVGRLDLLRRRALIAESATEIKGGVVFSTPKSHQARSVPIPRFLVDDLSAHVAGKGPSEFVFGSPRGAVLRVRNFRRLAFDRAASAIGLDGLHPHELRHTAASLAIASGADVKVVQQMLGHKSATMT